jgi:hypothetical protein
MKHTYTVEESDKADHESGLELIRVLRLKKQRHNGLYDLTHGNKTPCGVFRTVRGLCMSQAELNAGELLEALRFYAQMGTVSPATDEAIIEDCGDIARAAIAKATA